MTGESNIHPRISFVMPVYNPPVEVLRATFSALAVQTMPHWECVVVDDGSSDPEVLATLATWSRDDTRVRLVTQATNGGIAVATNAGLDTVTAPIVALVDHDDLLSADAAEAIVDHFDRHADDDVVYSDERIIDLSGRVIAEFNKPDYSPVRNLGQNYLNHLVAVRSAVIGDVRLRSEYEPAQDFDFWIRIIESIGTRGVGHIAKPLYGWRTIDGSTALSATAKPAMFEAVLRTVRSTIERRGLPATADTVLLDGAPTTQVRVSFPVPSPDEVEVIELGVDASGEALVLALRGVTRRYAVIAPSDLVDSEDRDWTLRLASEVARDGVAIAGAALVDGDGRTLSVGRVIQPTLADELAGSPLGAGPFGAFQVTREVSAVAPWGVAIDMDVFREIGGFGVEVGVDAGFAELCGRSWLIGQSVVWSPAVVLTLKRARLIEDPTTTAVDWSLISAALAHPSERFAPHGIAHLSGIQRGVLAEVMSRYFGGEFTVVIVAVDDVLAMSATVDPGDRYNAVALALADEGLLAPPAQVGAVAEALRAAVCSGARPWTEVVSRAGGVLDPDRAATVAEAVWTDSTQANDVLVDWLIAMKREGCPVVVATSDARHPDEIRAWLAEVGVPGDVIDRVVAVPPGAMPEHAYASLIDVCEQYGDKYSAAFIGDDGLHPRDLGGDIAQFDPFAAVRGVNLLGVNPAGVAEGAPTALANLSRRSGSDGGIRRAVLTGLTELGSGAADRAAQLGASTIGPLLAACADWIAGEFADADEIVVLGQVLADRVAESIAEAIAGSIDTGRSPVRVVGVRAELADVALAALSIRTLDELMVSMHRVVAVSSLGVLTNALGLDASPVDSLAAQIVADESLCGRVAAAARAAWERLGIEGWSQPSGRLVVADLVTDGGLGAAIANHDRSAGQLRSLGLTTTEHQVGLTAGLDRPPHDLARTNLIAWLSRVWEADGDHLAPTPIAAHATRVGVAIAKRLNRTQVPDRAGWLDDWRSAILTGEYDQLGAPDPVTVEVMRAACDHRFDGPDPAWERPLLTWDEFIRFGDPHDLSRDARHTPTSFDGVGVDTVGFDSAWLAAITAPGSTVAARHLVRRSAAPPPTVDSLLAVFRHDDEAPTLERRARLAMNTAGNAAGWALMTLSGVTESLRAVAFSAAETAAIVEIGLFRVRKMVDGYIESVDYRLSDLDPTMWVGAHPLGEQVYAQSAGGQIIVGRPPPELAHAVEIAVAYRCWIIDDDDPVLSPRPVTQQLVTGARSLASRVANRVRHT